MRRPAHSDVEPGQKPDLGHEPYWAHLELITIEAEWLGVVCQVKSKTGPERLAVFFAVLLMYKESNIP